MIWMREGADKTVRVSAAAGASTEIMRIAVFIVLIASIAGVLAAGTAKPDEPRPFENVPLCLHGS